jgi:anti-anti-sigma factor
MELSEIQALDSPQVMVVLANDPTEDTVVWLGGEHDRSSVEELARALTMVVDAAPSDVIIDLSRVEFMDGTTVNQILAVCTRLRAEGRMARVRRPSPPARLVLGLCDLSHLVAL